jgi:hypothetical protein
MSKDVRKALMIAKGPVSSGYLPPGHPEREANLARHMEGSVAPPVLYHGTSKDADFKKFNIPKNGAWFTTSTDAASSYAKDNDSQGYKMDWGWNITPTNTASRVVPVHLSAKNPKVYEDPKEFSDLTYSLAKDNYKRGQGILFDQLRQAGHDSVCIGGNTWVALSNPAQIKSATGNSGQFDPSNPDITKAEGGEVKSRHPALSIPGFHVREEIHGTPIFTGGRNAN